MNKKSVWAAGVFFLLTVITASAQNAPTVAKILPTNEKSVIKLLVAENSGKSATVLFYTDEGMIAQDAVVSKNKQGFIRKYDLSRIYHRNFRMQVITANASFTYDILKDANGITAELRETTQTFPVLAAR